MKANELMIGDWVQIVEPCKYADAIGRVKTLIDHKDDENTYFKVFLKNNTIHIGIEDICSDDIRPIPLTPEILGKNGFVKQNFDGWEYIHPDDSTFSYIDYRILWRTDYDNHLFIKKYKESGTSATLQISDINYDHQLQHALKLCGIEKEIIL